MTPIFKKLAALTIVSLFLAGCAGQTATPQNSTTETAEQTQQITTPTQQPAPGIDPEAELVINNDEIFHLGQKYGYIKDGRIYISFHDNTVSFEGDPAKLKFIDAPTTDMNQGFAYNGLELSTTFDGPFGYEQIKYDKISYKCDGSLVKTSNPREDVPNYYCVTNGEDSLSQFEFSGAGGYVVFTGGEAGKQWYKLYLKRIYGINYIFAGPICYTTMTTDNSVMSADDYNKLLNQDEIGVCSAIYGGGYDGDKAYKKIANITYLNRLLDFNYMKDKIQTWNKMVETFRVEQK